MIDIQKNIDLMPYNTFSVHAKTSYFAKVTSIAQLGLLLQNSLLSHLPKLMLGEGSNVLFTQDYAGLIIKNEIKGIEKVFEDDDHVLVKVGAGENWHQWVLYSIEQGWSGIENLSLIPGTVGAAPVQNIGAYGVELQEVFHELSAMNLTDGSMTIFNRQACEFSYRDSIFKSRYKNQYMITDVTLKLRKKPSFNIHYSGLQDMLQDMKAETLSLKVISDAVTAIRQRKLPNPKEIGNAGSFFKNPLVFKDQFDQLKEKYTNIPSFPDTHSDHVKISAGWLIEQCGWKGKRIGNVGVYDKQALVLVNYGAGTGLDIKNLAQQIQTSVNEKFGILLTPEVNII